MPTANRIFEAGEIKSCTGSMMDKRTEVIVTFTDDLNDVVMGPDEIKFQIGEMTKEPSEMTASEKANWEKQIKKDARKYLFSIGQPVVYENEQGRIVAEYGDGRIVVIN